jgi:hypothetical protein
MGRISLGQPRPVRDPSQLTAHKPEETPLQYAVTKMAGLIAQPHHDGAGTAGTVNPKSLWDYVRASLGMSHVKASIDPGLRPYLDQLSRNERTDGPQPPITLDSFKLLYVLYLADQKPGPADRFTRETFMDWLNGQLAPQTVRDDLIPQDYLNSVKTEQVHGKFTFEYDRNAENSVDVPTMRPSVPGDDLQGADLQERYPPGANLQGVNLQDLRGVDLRGFSLGGAKLDFDKLQGAKLDVTPELAVSIVFSRDADLTGTGLFMSTEGGGSCQQYVKKRMSTWKEAVFDLLFDHRNNNGRGALKNIAALDESCRDTKRALMHAMVGGLDGARAMQAGAVGRLVPSLGDVLFDDPEYLKGHDAFSAWLCGKLLGDGSRLLDTELSDAALEALGRHATGRLTEKGFEAIKDQSVAVYQVLYAMRARAAAPGTSAEVREKWTAQSEALHEQYRETLAGAHASLMGENGVYQNEREVLADDDAFPLISGDGRSCVIMTDERYRQLVLGDRSRISVDGTMAWADLRCVAEENGKFPASANDLNAGATRGTASVLEKFPLLAAARRRETAAAERARMLALAGLPAPLLDRFKAALQRRFTNGPGEKMTGDADQLALGAIFATKLENRDGQDVHLAPAHFAALREQWQGDSQEVFAFRLLCMAALYTNYASSHVFGTEFESPNALRAYAEALLRKTHELDPGLLPNAQFGDWVNRLKGKDDAFTCTSVLYGKQSEHLNAILGQEEDSGPLHAVRDEMIPLEWR